MEETNNGTNNKLLIQTNMTKKKEKLQGNRRFVNDFIKNSSKLAELRPLSYEPMFVTTSHFPLYNTAAAI